MGPALQKGQNERDVVPQGHLSRCAPRQDGVPYTQITTSQLKIKETAPAVSFSFVHVHRDVVGAVLLELAQIGVHPRHDLIIVLRRDGGIVHVPQRQLLR